MAEQSEFAASVGYSLAFFNSDPELKRLLASATSGDWSAARFVAALQNTKWFRTKNETYRKFVALQATDPQTYQQQLWATAAHIQTVGGQMGSMLPTPNALSLAKTALSMGWTDEQLRGFLSNNLTPDKNGTFGGQAGVMQQTLRKLAADYGVPVSDGWVNERVRGAVVGRYTAENAQVDIQNLAASKYVALADRIKAGESVRQIADPYIQTYAKTLEVDGENINLDDPLIQRALQAKDSKGKPTTQTLYDFEQTLRNDSRWAKTDNARDQMSSTASAVLRQFGLVS